MTQTTVSVLTPPGGAAVAVLAVRGPQAWPILRCLFTTARGRELAEPPAGFMVGRLGGRAGDEVILSTIGPDSFEVHCHGGRHVVDWLVGLMAANGVTESDPGAGPASEEAARLLPFARTTRTAAILLDQVHGAYDRAVQAVRSGGPEADAVRATLRRNARVGRHLVTPWRVAIAGPPNAGKSSLLNALAGFARSVVSPTAGTTRDAVSVTLAFDGWPAELTDTAGLRPTVDELEAAGVDRARAAVTGSDLVLWVVDATGPRPRSVHDVARPLGLDPVQVLVVLNKIDVAHIAASEFPDAVPVSAATGVGLPDLAARLAVALVPDPPAPRDPVPFTPVQCDRWSQP